jgi:hypothetical protein
MNIKDFHVGDEVITVINERDYVNGGRKDTIRKEKIMSVGRKYVQVTRFENKAFIDKFSAENNFPYGLVDASIIGEKCYLFKSMEDYQDYKKSLQLIDFIYDKLYYRSGLCNLTLEQLEAIKEIIDGNKEE